MKQSLRIKDIKQRRLNILVVDDEDFNLEIIGELLQFGGDFNKYVTARKLQKEEGILFRHCLRMILLLDEMANVPPAESTVETWEDPLDELAQRLTDSCREIDPQSTDEMLAEPGIEEEDLVGLGRRN